MGRNYRKSVHEHDDDIEREEELRREALRQQRADSPDRGRTNPYRSRSHSRERTGERERERTGERERERTDDHRGRGNRDRNNGDRDDLKVNSVHHGRVTSCRDFGCFVRLPRPHNRDGLLHISQVSHQRISADELRELLPVGREVWVKVLEVKEDGKIGLSAKNVPGHEADALGGGGGAGDGDEGSSQAQQLLNGRPVGRGQPPSGKPPDLFSIHRAVVSNATDFAVFATLQPSGWDVMIHSTQCDEAHLRECGAKYLSDGYPRGARCWVKVSAVDGYSTKAKLQGSIKYVDQATGDDRDPDNSKILMDLVHRGLPSELNRRWAPPGAADEGEEGEADEAALQAGAPFVPCARFVGARPGYVFTRREVGLGYHRDARAAAGGGGGDAGALLQQMLEKIEAGRKERKREKKEKKERKKKKEKKKDKDKKEKEHKEKKAKRERSESSSSSRS